MQTHQQGNASGIITETSLNFQIYPLFPPITCTFVFLKKEHDGLFSRHCIQQHYLWCGGSQFQGI